MSEYSADDCCDEKIESNAAAGPAGPTETLLKFTPVRLIIVGKAIGAIAWLAVVGMLMGGLDSIGVERREFVLTGINPSFLLFPNIEYASIVDVLYLVALGVAPGILCLLCCLCTRCLDEDDDRDIDDYARDYWPVSLLPLMQLYCHLCANLHWQFLGAVGAIGPENVFWIFDWRSFFCGIGPAILVSILLMAFLYALYYVFSGRLCFDRVVVETKTNTTPV